MGGAWLAYAYGVLRLKELQRVSGGPLIFSPGTVKKAQAMLRSGGWVAGTPDVPPTETALGTPVTLFDRPAHFAEGLLVIARRAGVPVVIFTLGLDLSNGRRRLEVLGQHDPDALNRRRKRLAHVPTADRCRRRTHPGDGDGGTRQIKGDNL